MRHSRLPLYAILGAVLIIAAWVHSFWKSTGVSYDHPTTTGYSLYICGSASGKITLASIPLPLSLGLGGVRFLQDPNRAPFRWADLKPVSFHSMDGDGYAASINYWFILLLYTAFWLTLLSHLSRRRKSHPTPPSPPVIEK